MSDTNHTADEFERLESDLSKAYADLAKANARADLLQAEWERTLNAIPDPIFIEDIDFTIIKANTAFADSVHMDIPDILGKKCYAICHDAGVPVLSCPMELTKKEGKMQSREVVDTKNNKVFLVTTAPVYNGSQMLGAIHTSKDITNFKTLEKELKDRITEMGRFQKITVGRELRMRELKIEISKLKETIRQYKGND